MQDSVAELSHGPIGTSLHTVFNQVLEIQRYLYEIANESRHKKKKSKSNYKLISVDLINGSINDNSAKPWLISKIVFPANSSKTYALYPVDSTDFGDLLKDSLCYYDELVRKQPSKPSRSTQPSMESVINLLLEHVFYGIKNESIKTQYANLLAQAKRSNDNKDIQEGLPAKKNRKSVTRTNAKCIVLSPEEEGEEEENDDKDDDGDEEEDDNNIIATSTIKPRNKDPLLLQTEVPALPALPNLSSTFLASATTSVLPSASPPAAISSASSSVAQAAASLYSYVQTVILGNSGGSTAEDAQKARLIDSEQAKEIDGAEVKGANLGSILDEEDEEDQSIIEEVRHETKEEVEIITEYHGEEPFRWTLYNVDDDPALWQNMKFQNTVEEAAITTNNSCMNDIVMFNEDDTPEVNYAKFITALSSVIVEDITLQRKTKGIGVTFFRYCEKVERYTTPVTLITTLNYIGKNKFVVDWYIKY